MRRLIPLLFLVLVPVVFAAYTFYPNHFFDTGSVIYSFQAPTTISSLQYGSGYLLLNGSVNYSFTVPSGTKAYINLSTPTIGESQAIATLKDSGEHITLQPFTLYFNTSKDDGTLMPVWNASVISLNYTLGDKDWVEVNYSLNGGTSTTLSSETAVVSQTQWDASQNASFWNGVAFNATETYYLRKAHLYFTVAGTYNVTILDSNLNILDSVTVTSAGGDTEISGWQNVKLTSGNTYYLLANTSTDSNLAYMSSDVLANACWANSIDLTSVTLDCTGDTYFKLIKLTYTNATLSPSLGYNNVTLTAKDSAGSTYSLLWEFINANRTIYSNLWHTIYASGAIERERIFQNGSFDNYVNISDKVSVSVASGTVEFYDDIADSVGFRLKDFTSQVNITITGQGTRRLTPTGTVYNYNETAYSSTEVRFWVNGTGTLALTITGLQPNRVYNRIVDGSKDKEVSTNSAGELSDTLTLSAHTVVYQIQTGSAAPPPAPGGGGGGGGSEEKKESELKFCPKLNISIAKENWTSEICELDIFKIGKAVIFYVTHDYKKTFICPYLDLEGLKISECREKTLYVNKTVYIGGGAFTQTGSLLPENYEWYFNNKLLAKKPIFEYVFTEPGEGNLTVVAVDSTGKRYEASTYIKIVGVVAEEVPPPILQENVTIAEKIGNKTITLLEKLYTKQLEFFNLTKSVGGKAAQTPKTKYILITIFSVIVVYFFIREFAR